MNTETIDEFDGEPDAYGADDGLFDTSNEQWECVFPGTCVMGYQEHMSSECFTVEMAEDYAKSMASRAGTP